MLNSLKHYGTGSYPPSWYGLHRIIRLIERISPLPGPYFFIASKAYAEQVGVYLQLGGNRGEIQIW